jgi:hypothetical protein
MDFMSQVSVRQTDHICAGDLRRHLLGAAGAYVLGTGIVLLSVLLISPLVPKRNPGVIPDATGLSHPEFLCAVSRWDGQRYLQISKFGYQYNPRELSNVAFFPVYPLAVRAVGYITRMSLECSALVVSLGMLLGSFLALGAYVASRMATTASLWTLLAFAVFPTTFFLRMTYSEATFLLLAVLSLVGIERKWPLLCIATIVGVATATRPVGVALLAPLTLDAVRRWRSSSRSVLRLFLLLPVACSGLGAFVLFQWSVFGDPLAFLTAQQNHNWQTVASLSHKLLVLGTLEPIWSVYDPTSTVYWAAREPHLGWALNLQFANPIYFVLALLLVGVGTATNWLSDYEVLVSLALLLIPYCTRSYEMGMAGHGRFVSVVFPIYVVLGHVLARSPVVVRVLILGLSTFYLASYSALFGAGYMLI